MINLRNITKTYGKKENICLALDKVSLDLPKLGMVFITGESGCGKSTMLNIIGGLDAQTSGHLYYDNKLIESNNLSSYRNKEVGVIFQKFNLINSLTVEENLSIVYEIAQQPIDTDKINYVLEKVELAGFNNRNVKELSGGEEQRVAIARAIITDCRLLLADEPTGNLDTVNSITVLDILKKMSKERLVVIVSHESEYVKKYADRIILLQDGKVISDTVKNENFSNEYVENNGIGYIAKNISKETVDLINRRKCNEYVLVADERYTPISGKLEKNLSSEKYDGKIKTNLSFKTTFKIAFSNIFRHKIRFVLLIIAAFLVFSLLGTSFMLANYNIGDVAAKMLEQNNEKTITISNGVEFPPFGYTDTTQRYAIIDSKEEYIENLIGSQSDELFLLIGSLYLSDNKSDNPYMSNNLMGYTESSIENLSNYDFSLLAGDYPDDKRINNHLKIAVTDYTAYIIEQKGAYFSDGISHNNFDIGLTASELIDKVINLGSEMFYITGVIDTDYEDFLPYITGESVPSTEVSIELTNRINLYYSTMYFAKNATERLYTKFQKYVNSAVMNYSAFANAMNGVTVNGETSNKKPPKVTWSNGVNGLDDDSVLLTDSHFREFYGESFKVDKEYYNEFILNSGPTVLYQKTMRVAGVISSVNLDYMPDRTTMVLSENLFNEIVNGNTLKVGYHWVLPDSKEIISDVINSLADNSMYYIGNNSTVLYEMYTMMDLYKTIFLLSSILLILIACALLFDFFRTNIKDKESDIGVLMALGLSGKTSTKILFAQIAIIFCILLIVIVTGIFVFSAIMGTVLTATLTAALSTQVVAQIPTIVYSFPPFVISIGALIGAIILSTLYLTIVIIRKKPIENIKG